MQSQGTNNNMINAKKPSRQSYFNGTALTTRTLAHTLFTTVKLTNSQDNKTANETYTFKLAFVCYCIIKDCMHKKTNDRNTRTTIA